ncbi:MAG: MotA/TolQ/ExbB proton channel family protein [Pseudomonadota bacterium]
MRTLSLASSLRVAASFVLPIIFSLGAITANAQAPAAPGASAAVTAPAAAPGAATPEASVGASAPKAAAASAENPYGIEALWKGSDNIARAVLLILAIMSIGSWYIMVVKLLEQSKMKRHAATVDKAFWDAKSVSAGAAALEKNSAYRFIAESGAAATTDHGGLKGHIPMAEWIPMSITSAVDRVNSTMQGGLAFLATVGSTSPFVGLFGTVWGIYHALTAIGISGQASIDKVAGPVGEALIMTAIGLAVAIPAVFAYNWLARRNKAVMDDVREFSDELNAVIVGSAGKAA